MKIDDLCREYGISNPTYYKWKSKYGGMDVNEAKRATWEWKKEHRMPPEAARDYQVQVQVGGKWKTRGQQRKKGSKKQSMLGRGMMCSKKKRKSNKMQ